MTEEDFLNWREHPVTQAVFAELEASIVRNRAEFERSIWEFNHVNINALNELKAREAAWRDVIDNRYENWKGNEDV